MSKERVYAISPKREEDYSEWYQQVIKAADLSENSAVRGCMVIKPWGFAIWERMKEVLDAKFKETGHENAYFPLFIPLSYLEKEAEHVDGFAKECAVVTHHRLEADGKGGLKPAGKLDEPLVVRPTSEMIIGATYAKWVQSYRDLPILINQWANVVRWEMRTRNFLRTSEFLWQEGHTVHSTSEEAVEETKQMLDVYSWFAEEYMALPVIKGEKAAHERFPGAIDTYTIEAMMQDRKALQSGTSHFLGQNFSKAMNIKFQSEAGKEELAWTTSWGVSTRLIGALIMAHSDDDGLVLPPKLAPKQVVILPVIRKNKDKDTVMEYCEKLQKEISQLSFDGERVRVLIDKRDMRGGEKTWSQIKRGVPVRIEVGPRDIDKDSVFMGRRDKDPKDKLSLSREDFISQLPAILEDVQTSIYSKASEFRKEHSKNVDSLDELKDFFKNEDKQIHGGFAFCYVADNDDLEDKLKELKLTHRCIPLDEEEKAGSCIFTGEAVKRRSVIAKAY
jgi:prolyl-tRNA synthetase